MKQKSIFAIALMHLVLADVTFAADGPASFKQAKPNIVLILADDLRADGLGVLGNTIVKTPNIDKLAANGFIFRNAYTMGADVGAVCLPSRTMIQTGRSYFRTAPSNRNLTVTNPATLAQTLNAVGYATIRSGKVDNGPKMLDDEFTKHQTPRGADKHADNLIAFMKENKSQKPLFLYMASNEPHDPQPAPAAYYDQYDAAKIPLPPNFLPQHPFNNGEMAVRDEKTLPWPRTKESVTGKLARYYASTTFWDAQVGRLVEELKAAGQFENTIFVIAGDNGLSLGEHGLLGKQNLYEFGGMHVPLIFAGAGIPKGESKSIAYLMDLLPTFCELSSTEIPAGWDGKSLLPVITGKSKSVRDYGFTAYRDCQRSVRDAQWKLIRYPLINKTQLFDLNKDPREMQDLAAQPEQAERIRELLGVLKKQQELYGDKAPLEVAEPQDAAWTPPKTADQEPTKKKAKS